MGTTRVGTTGPRSRPTSTLREALQHLSEARDSGDLRKTNTVTLEEVENTVSTVLREYEQDE